MANTQTSKTRFN